MKIGDFGLATVKSRWSGSGQQYKQVGVQPGTLHGGSGGGWYEGNQQRLDDL